MFNDFENISANILLKGDILICFGDFNIIKLWTDAAHIRFYENNKQKHIDIYRILM